MKLYCKNTKLWFGSLFAFILITIDILSLFVLLKHCQKTDTESSPQLSWGKPSSIVLSHHDKQVVVTPDDALYDKILELNMWRTELIEYYSETESAERSSETALCMEYRYKTPYTIFLPLASETRKLLTKQIFFYLTGENNNVFCIDTGKEQVSITPLNTSVELIETANQLLK